VLSGTLGCKGKEATGGWRKLLNEGLYDLYPSSGIRANTSKSMPLAGHAAQLSYMRNMNVDQKV
jgi:hypothetical protein